MKIRTSCKQKPKRRKHSINKRDGLLKTIIIFAQPKHAEKPVGWDSKINVEIFFIKFQNKCFKLKKNVRLVNKGALIKFQHMKKQKTKSKY